MDYYGVKMTIPKKLEEKRNLFIDSRYGNDLWPKNGELYRIVAKESWNDCANLLLPEIEKLEKALFKLTVRLDESGSIHDIKPSADIVKQALKSWQEFLNEK